MSESRDMALAVLREWSWLDAEAYFAANSAAIPRLNQSEIDELRAAYRRKREEQK